ncbi:MAG TPA: lytic transglycosylase domain-containing protein [Rhizobiaceae bacterium]|nr:lytic transglycosylase domain-containing protein [Rhizobiaceae bacterium]
MQQTTSLQPGPAVIEQGYAPLPESVEVLPTVLARAEGIPVVAEAGAQPAAPVMVASLGEMPVPIGEAAPMIVPASYAKADNIIGGSSSRLQIDALIAKYAAIYELPVEFVHAVVKRESTYNPNAHNKGHWGLMQIKHATARGMGYNGTARGLLDPETNLKYAVKYLKGAYMVADGNQRLADRMYQRGYYYDAKRKGLLDETGLGRDRVRKRRSI